MKYILSLALIGIASLVLLFFWAGIIKNAEEATRASLNQNIKVLERENQHLRIRISALDLEKNISANAFLVKKLSDNSIILEKNSYNVYPIASITKLMNALIALDNIPPNDTIILTSKILEPLGYSPSLFLGLRVTAGDLLRASLIQSTNDAAEALAYFLGRERFIDLMNQKSAELKMAETFFKDPHGLDSKSQSSASDIDKLISYIFTNRPEIMNITKDDNFWMPDKTGKMLKFKNMNNFYNFPEFIGGKTGYILAAKQTLASIFEINGEPISIVLLYSENRYSDTIKILDWLKENPFL